MELPLLLEFIILLALVMLHLMLGVLLHEGGHLVLGLATGYRFVSFNVLSFVAVREDGRLRLRRNKNKLMAGQCLLAPPEDEGRFRWFWYNAGGGLFNLLFAALALLGAVLTRGSGTLSFGFFVMGFTMNAVLALTNLIPMTVGIPNDGLNIVMAAKSPLARHGLYLMFRVNDKLQAGRRYRDIPEEFLATGGEVNPRNYFEVYILILRAARLDDMDEHAAAQAVYSGLNLGRLNAYYANAIRLDTLYYYCMYSREPDKAREIYSDRKIKQMLQNPVPTLLRVNAAAQYFLLGQRESAQRLIEQARALLLQAPSPGLRTMETEALDELAEAMEADEQNSLGGEA